MEKAGKGKSWKRKKLKKAENGKGKKWKRKKMEKEENGKGKSWKRKKLEKEENGKGRKWKRKKMENKKVLTLCRDSDKIPLNGKPFRRMNAEKMKRG